jgi:DNA repair exonuclease SbcCD ATPase subunit
MKPTHIYIENFMCYENAYIDLTQFNSALIVGKIENNDMYSNGVGKTSIFKAIEYSLFNQADVNLENIIMDDSSFCRIVIDFYIGDKEYRLSRKRTRKGSTDLSLYERTATDGKTEEAYHSVKEDARGELYTPLFDKKYWKDLSGDRASDTESDLNKLIKINFKSFRSTMHFLQNDLNGLATTTSEKRKDILKEALDLLVYAKLEKISKDRYNSLVKEIEKNKTLLENLGNPSEDLLKLIEELAGVEKNLAIQEGEIITANDNFTNCNNKITDLQKVFESLESKFSSLLEKDKTLSSEKSRLEISVKEYTSKKTNAIGAAKKLIQEISTLKEEQLKLVDVDYSQIDILNEKLNEKKEEVTTLNLTIKNHIVEYDELKIPLPDDNICKHCRQPTSDDHRKECQKQINARILECQETIKKSKAKILSINGEVSTHQQNINSLSLSKKKLEDINTSIAAKSKEIQDKKELHQEYVSILEKFSKELEEKNKEIDSVKEELANSSMEESKQVKEQIKLEKVLLEKYKQIVQDFTKKITHFTSAKAVVSHNIEQKNQDIKKQEDLRKKLEELNNKIITYPSVIQAFSTTGIPNLIIQNVLDDLQIESNNLLKQLKPGLQLTFSTVKTQDDGTEKDKLDILYQINGKERYFEQLSGAMKLAVVFSLKLGLSFLLLKMIGTDIKFLLLDEIDQSLDKAGVDAFADIVKFFQKDFTILVITHNDRLKDKFSHAVLVEQNINMVSRARVVSSW